MVHQGCNGFWRQEVEFVVVQRFEDLSAGLVVASFVRELRHLHEQHECVERQLLVLGVEHEQGQEVVLQCVPLAESLSVERLSGTLELEQLDDFFDAVFTPICLHVDVCATYLLDTSDSLDPEEQLVLVLPFLLSAH